MTPESRDSLLIETMAAILGIPAGSIDDDTSTDTVEGWDSITHLNLVIALEETFSVSFSPEESLGITSVRMMKLLLDEKMAGV